MVLRAHLRDTAGTPTGSIVVRRARAAKLETRSSRLRLPVAKKPVFVKIGLRVGLGYRRNQTAGTWVLRVADGKGGNWTKAIGFADDFDEPNGNTTLDFWQAQDRARAIARVDRGDHGDGKPVTVLRALDLYEGDLKTRGGDVGNVARVRLHLPETLADKKVALLTARDLRNWRDGLVKHLAAATVNRTASALKAALNLAAEHDERIISRQPWEIGLAGIPDAEESRNVILAEPDVHTLLARAYEHNTEFGLLVELAAVTGARVSQLARLEVQDVQCDRTDPRLMMPSSRKGRGQKKIMRRPVPIPADLAARLKLATTGKSGNAPLLVKSGGDRWKRSNHTRSFQKTVTGAGMDTSLVTINALRHTSIVRQILAGVPIRVVAVNHDTSITMLERTYSRHIGDHSDALARGALLNTKASPKDNVVPIVKAR
jgi:integrase